MAESGSESRTHGPSARRIEQARAAGRIVVSRDFTSAIAVLAACAALAAGARAASGAIVVLTRDLIQGATSGLSVRAALASAAQTAAAILALPMAAAMLAALVAAYPQTRGLFRPQLLCPDRTRLTPRLGRLLSADGVFLSTKELCSLLALVVVTAVCLGDAPSVTVRLVGSRAPRVLETIVDLIRHWGLALAFTLLVLGTVDYAWQAHRHWKALRMTRDEVKREYKEIEGDPIFKSERRRTHVELLQSYVLADVAESDVVVAEPGIVAVALRYAPEVADAPVVVFTGRNDLALRIEDLAAGAGVPVVEDCLLARRLACGDVGDAIPAESYEAVAELLAQVKPGLRTGARQTIAKA